MLSKEEADNLFEKLNVLLGPIYNIGAVESFILDFTEKPKREVQLGDIYKNGKKEIVGIFDIRKDANYPLMCKRHTTVIEHYTLDGKNESGLSFLDLDFSKRYKFVEVENNKIYLVTSGEGVETFIHKCFFNKEKAQKYSDMEQEKEDARELGYLGRFEVEEIELEVE
jgi:hypothetical protein